MKYVDSAFVKFICLTASGVIMLVFVTMTALIVPAFIECWPAAYADLLGLCKATPIPTPLKQFTPVAYDGKNIAFNSENKKYRILVFYRLERQTDAEHIVGALRTAGYQCDGNLSTLDEVFATDKRPGTTLIKTTALARPTVDTVQGVVGISMPVNAQFVSVLGEDTLLQRGDIQIDLF